MANIPTTNNSPGDIKNSSGQFQTYGTPIDGQAALYNDLTAKMTGKSIHGLTPDSTLVDFARVYDGSKNDSDNLQYAANLANSMGISPDTKIGTLLPHIDQFARAVANAEGYKGPWSGSMDTKITDAQQSSFNPNPFGSGPGQIDLSNTNGQPNTNNPAQDAKQIAGQLAGGAGRAVGNFGIGEVEGLGNLGADTARTISNSPVGKAANAVSKFFGAKTNDKGQTASQAMLDNAKFTPHGTAQGVGNVFGKYVLPAALTSNAIDDATNGVLSKGAGKVVSGIKTVANVAKTATKYAALPALLYETVKNPAKVKNLIGSLIDLL